jgi:hypothetical protein
MVLVAIHVRQEPTHDHECDRAPQDKRAAIAIMIELCDLSERRACRLVGLSRDSWRPYPAPLRLPAHPRHAAAYSSPWRNTSTIPCVGQCQLSATAAIRRSDLTDRSQSISVTGVLMRCRTLQRTWPVGIQQTCASRSPQKPVKSVVRTTRTLNTSSATPPRAAWPLLVSHGHDLKVAC